MAVNTNMTEQAVLNSVYDSTNQALNCNLVAGDIEIGAVEIKNAATDDRVLVSDANTGRAATDHVLSVQQLAADGTVPPSGSLVSNAPFGKVTDGTSTVAVLARTTGLEVPAVTDDALVVYDVAGATGVSSGGYPMYVFDSTNSFGHGQTAYTAATQVTVTGLSFTPNVQALVKIERYDTTGAYVASYSPQKNLITYSAGVYTVTGVTFTATDTFVIYQQGPERTTNLATNSQQTGEMNPLNQQYVEESLVDTTNVAAAATYYPSSLGMAMGGYKNFSITGKYIDADAGATTLTVQATCDEDSTNANWVSVQGQVQGITGTVTGTVAGVAGTAIVPGSIATVLSTALAQTTTFAWDFDDLNARFVRVVLTPFDATNTAIIKARRSY